MRTTALKPQVARMAEASPNLRVSEDKKQIGRAKVMTEEDIDERVARTVQVRCVTTRHDMARRGAMHTNITAVTRYASRRQSIAAPR